MPLPSSIASSRDSNPSRRRTSGLSRAPEPPEQLVCLPRFPSGCDVGGRPPFPRGPVAFDVVELAPQPAARATRDRSQSRARCSRARLSWLTGATSTRYRVRARHPSHTRRTRCRIWRAGRHRERFSERLLEPMSSSVTPLREGYALPRHREVVSPELALVDPELAASARASLPEPRAAGGRSGPSARAQVGDGSARALTALSNAALAMDDERGAPTHAGRSWRVLIGVAAVTILSLLLFDVRVQVGKTPASAEAPQKPPAAAATLSRAPVPSVPREACPKGERRGYREAEGAPLRMGARSWCLCVPHRILQRLGACVLREHDQT